MREAIVSKQTLQRLPLYFNYLKGLPSDTQNISATSIADKLGLNDVQVRKDLASISSGGKPRIGYITQKLIKDIRDFLMCSGDICSVMVGMGNLGRALTLYKGFSEYGLGITAAFDNDSYIAGSKCGGVEIFHMDLLEQICLQRDVRIGIITVSPQDAQGICNRLVSSGIRAIWNFAPVHLSAPEGVLIQNEDMAASLAMLSYQLMQKTGITTEEGTEC